LCSFTTIVVVKYNDVQGLRLAALLASRLVPFAFYSRFAFSSEKCVFVAIRNLDVVDFERVASLRLSLVLRLEIQN
jgi:hypothetical protein